MSGLAISKVHGFALLGEPDALAISKLFGFVLLDAGPPSTQVAGTTSITFTLLPTADIFPEGIAGVTTLTFDVPAVAVGDGGFVAAGQVAGDTSLTFLLQGEMANPSSFPDNDGGLSRGPCPRPRLASAFCEEREADAIIECEARQPKMATNKDEHRTAAYYQEE